MSKEEKEDFNHMVVIQTSSDFDYLVMKSIDIKDRLIRNGLDPEKHMERFLNPERKRIIIYGYRQENV